MCRLSWNLGSSTSWNPQAYNGIALLFTFIHVFIFRLYHSCCGHLQVSWNTDVWTFFRKVERSQSKYEVLCVECHPDRKLYRASDCNYLQQMENQVLRFLQLLHSPDENVRLLMVRTLKKLSTHISSFHQPEVQQCWLHLLRDENMSVRTSFAFYAKYLVFNPKWMEEKQSESETLLDEHIPLSQKDKRQLTQSIPLLSYCVEEITKVVYESLATRDRGLQHTIIFAVRSLGRCVSLNV